MSHIDSAAAARLLAKFREKRRLATEDRLIYCAALLLALGAVVAGYPLVFPKQIHMQAHTKAVNDIAFSPTGALIATVSDDKSARLWTSGASRPLRTIQGHSGRITCAAFGPDAKCIATGSNDKTIKIWDVETGIEIRTLRGHRGAVVDLAYTPDGARLISVDGQKTIRMWNARTGDTQRTIETEKVMCCLAISPDGSLIAAGGWDECVTLWNVETGEPARVLNVRRGVVEGVHFSPDGRSIATASRQRSVCVWDMASGREKLSVVGHAGPVYDVAFTADGARIISGDAFGIILVADCGTVLNQKQLDDEAFEQLSKLTALRRLSLYGSSVSDAGLEKKAVGQLRSLGLGRTAITDKGLSHLASLPKLGWLWITIGRGVSVEAVEKLKATHPELEIFRQ